jgi:hypothetical protein
MNALQKRVERIKTERGAPPAAIRVIEYPDDTPEMKAARIAEAKREKDLPDDEDNLLVIIRQIVDPEAKVA